MSMILVASLATVLVLAVSTAQKNNNSWVSSLSKSRDHQGVVLHQSLNKIVPNSSFFLSHLFVLFIY